MPRARSPNYPAISLPEAIEKANKIYLKEHTHKASPIVVAQAIGYRGINGKSLSVLSALKKYGLLEEIDKDLRIPKEALAMLVDSKDSTERQAAIRKAAFAPALFADLQNQYGETLPSDDNLRSYLLKRGFTPASVDVPIRAYRQTIELVTTEGGEYDSQENQLDDDEMVEELSALPVKTGQQAIRALAVHSAKGGSASPPQLAEVGVYPVSKNTMVRLLATRPLTETAVKNLIKHLQMGVDVGIYPSIEDEEKDEK